MPRSPFPIPRSLHSRREIITKCGAGLAAIIAAGKAPAAFIRSMIGARSALTSSSGWTNPYVTDGLVAMWDGEWNVAGGVHDPNATTWVDLINGYNCDLTTLTGTGSVTVEDKSLLKEGYITPSKSYATQIAPNHWTIEAAINFLVADNANLHSGVGRYPVMILNNTIGIDYGVYSSSTAHIRRQFSYDAGYGVAPGKIRAGTFVHVQADFSGADGAANQTIYHNGIVATQTSGKWSGSTTSTVYITAFQSGNTKASFRSYCTRIYDRALTAAEIAANYAVDKARFNLP